MPVKEWWLTQEKFYSLSLQKVLRFRLKSAQSARLYILQRVPLQQYYSIYFVQTEIRSSGHAVWSVGRKTSAKCLTDLFQ